MLLRHCGLGEIEQRTDIRRKLDGLVDCVEADGVVQEEKIGLLMRVPFHLADERLLLLSIYGV